MERCLAAILAADVRSTAALWRPMRPGRSSASGVRNLTPKQFTQTSLSSLQNCVGNAIWQSNPRLDIFPAKKYQQ